MSAGMIRTVSGHHDRLAQAVAGLAGHVLTAAEVKAAYAAAHPDRPADVQFVIASDHCSNRTNKGACECALTPRAVFERVGYGQYLVLPGSDTPGAAPQPAAHPVAAKPAASRPRRVAPPASAAGLPLAPPRVEVTGTLTTQAGDPSGRMQRAKLLLEIAAVAVTVVSGVVALVWRLRS